MTENNDQRPNPAAGFRCLAIEASTGTGSIAATAGERISTREFPQAALQSRHLYAGVEQMLTELGVDLADLDCVAFGCGPGTFTGLRVTAAATQALAYGAELPVVRISSLAALAAGARRLHGASEIVASLDARMHEVYVGHYALDAVGRLEAREADRLVDPGALRLTTGQPFFAAGPGWSVIPEMMDNHAAQISGRDVELLPAAVDVLQLAEICFRRGDTVAAHEALPNYIRDNVTD